MSSARSRRLVVVAALGAFVAIVAAVVDWGGPWPALVVLGAGVAAGEILELRPEGRAAIPLSIAVIVVLIRSASRPEFWIVVGSAEVLAIFLRPVTTSMAHRIGLFVLRMVQAGAALSAFLVVRELLVDGDIRIRVLCALTAASIAPILVADVVEAIRTRRLPPLTAGRSVDLALVTSAILMAVSERGIDGQVNLGLWGPILFSIPLLAAWYSFERLSTARHTYEQTIEALSLAPELGGLSASGHSQRVADLVVEMGRELGMNREAVERLRVAAMLHHLGAVCLDVPSDGLLDWTEVAASSAAMLRATPALTPAGDLVAASPRSHRAPRLPYAAETPVTATTALGAQVLRVASEFDDLTAGDTDRIVVANGLHTFYSGPGYLYDGRVLGALERVLERRGYVPSPA